MKESRYLSPEEEPLSLAELELESSPQAASIPAKVKATRDYFAALAMTAREFVFLKRFIWFPFLIYVTCNIFSL